MSGNTDIVMPLLALIAAITGLVCFRKGLRGRRIHERPLCSKCGYELTGRAPDSVRCPECGGDISTAAGIRFGAVERRWGLLLGGVFILLVAGTWSTWVVRKIDWIKVKPAWLLTMEAKGAAPQQHNLALGELCSRMAKGHLWPGQIASLVDTALDIQADRAMPFDREWGVLIEAASKLGRVSNAQWRRYVTQAMDGELKLEVSKPFAIGDSLTATVNWGPGEPRCGRSVGIQLLIEGEPQLHIGNRAVDAGAARELTSTGGLLGVVHCGNAPYHPLLHLTIWPKPTELELGRWPVKYRVRFRVYDQYSGPNSADRRFVMDKTVELKDQIDVLPRKSNRT